MKARIKLYFIDNVVSTFVFEFVLDILAIVFT